MAQPVAVVIGIGSGLGASVARRFARGGFALGLVARSAGALESLRDELEKAGQRALAVSADAGDAKDCEAAIERIRRELGAPSVLVYNAGAFKMAGILELSSEDFDACFRANCTGAFHASRAVLPAMLENKKGTVLFTGATAALRGGARFAGLAVGKFGLRALSQSMAREFGPQGIHVAHVVIDGQIDTPRVRGMLPNRETHTMLSPDSIAEAYWQLHCQDPSAWTLELDLRPAVERF